VESATIGDPWFGSSPERRFKADVAGWGGFGKEKAWFGAWDLTVLFRERDCGGTLEV